MDGGCFLVSLYLDNFCTSKNFPLLIYNEKETLGQNTTIEFYVTFDLTTGYVRPQFGLGTGWRNYGAYIQNFTGWKFDKTTRFEFCTDSSGNNVASCTVKSLATEYQYSATGLFWVVQFFGGVDRKRFLREEINVFYSCTQGFIHI